LQDRLGFFFSHAQKSWSKSVSAYRVKTLWRQEFSFDFGSEFFIVLFQSNKKKRHFIITVSKPGRRLVPFSLSS
jgi:hypothetical protein